MRSLTDSCMRDPIHPIRIFLTILFFTSPWAALPQSQKYWPKRPFPYLLAENKLWIGTPSGLYQFHFDEDSWSIFGEHNGLADDHVRAVHWDGQWIWALTDSGLSYGDVRLNKWVTFDGSSGLPGGRIHSIAFQEDYAWIGTDRGAARFDKLIQEWDRFGLSEGLPDTVVFDVATDGPVVYFATARGLAEYHVQFEKWRYYGKTEGIACDTIRFILQTTEDLWLFTSDGPLRFNKKMHSTLSFAGDPRMRYDAIQDLFVVNEEFWIATSGGVLVYDPGAAVWRDYPEAVRLPDPVVNSMFIGQQESWFATEKGVVVRDERDGTWQTVDRSAGLDSDRFDAAASFMGWVFLINGQSIDYMRASDNRWKVLRLQEVSRSSGRKTPYLSLDRMQGSYLQAAPEWKIGLSGTRYTLYRKQSAERDWHGGGSSDRVTSAQRRDLKGQIFLPGGRTVNGFYNDTDFSEVLYGIRYKGVAGDWIQDVQWGDVRHEQGKGNLLPSIGVFGSYARLEAGPKTERYKRSLFSFQGVSGEKTSGYETEFLMGNNQDLEIRIPDTSYIRLTFFALDTAGGALPVKAGSETVFRDDGLSSNNNANTLAGIFIAGIAGDFDLLHPVVDYALDAKNGFIRFVSPVGSGSTVGIRCSSDGFTFEQIIKKEGETGSEQVNRYSLGGLGIIPHSLKIEITDPLGGIHDIAEFGLDQDRNGQVDPVFTDFTQGILTFPARRPFPASVYTAGKKTSAFSLHVRYQTEISSFRLKHDRLIRGSEQVFVDGEKLNPGEDYVLDYTYGLLGFIKEGVMAEDREVRIEYEYYRDTRETFHAAGVGFSPSDDVLVEAGFFQFDESGNTRPDPVRGYRALGEFKWRAAGADFKFTPEFSTASLGNETGSSSRFRADISSERLRLFSAFENREKAFHPLHPRLFRLGQLREQVSAGATFYPAGFLDAEIGWEKKSGYPSGSSQPEEEDLTGKILFNKSCLPAVSFTAQQQAFQMPDGRMRKKSGELDFEYQVPGSLLRKIQMKSLRAFGVWRRSLVVSDFEGLDSERVYDYQYWRLECSPVDQVQANGYIRRKGVYTAEKNADRLLSRQQKLFLDLIVDRFPGISLNSRYEGVTQDQFPQSIPELRNHSLDRRVFTSLRLFPGRWVAALSSFSLEFDYQPVYYGLLRNTDVRSSAREWLWKIADNDEPSVVQDNNMIQVRGDWRPHPRVLLHGGRDFSDLMSRTLSSRSPTGIRRDFIRAEIKPTLNSMFILSLDRSTEMRGDFSRLSRQNPLIWIEWRVAPGWQVKINLTYWEEKRLTGVMREFESSMAPLIGLTYRRQKPGYTESLLEIRDDVYGTFFRSERSGSVYDYNSYSNSFSLEYNPLSVLLLRTRLVTTYHDTRFSDSDRISNLLELRMSLQL